MPTPRPQLYCHVEEKFDHYQGSVEHKTYDMVYWAGRKELEAAVGPDGVASVVQVCQMHRKVLVVSAGRGEFWRQIISEVSERASREEEEEESPGEESGLGMVWGQIGFQRINKKFCNIVHGCDRCNGEARTCKRCLRNLKHRVAEIPDKKWSVRTSEAAVQTDALAQTQRLPWARRVILRLKALCEPTPP